MKAQVTFTADKNMSKSVLVKNNDPDFYEKARLKEISKALSQKKTNK